jgi:ribonuclease HII
MTPLCSYTLEAVMFQRNCCLCFQDQDTKTKHGQAINKLKIKPDLILTDAEKLSSDYNYLNIINGDNLSQSTAAASILAKVTCDNLMQHYHQQYLEYNFKNNNKFFF